VRKYLGKIHLEDQKEDGRMIFRVNLREAKGENVNWHRNLSSSM
jgi:hypothetical protein